MYRTWVEISKQALIHNLKTFRNFLPKKVKIMAIVKSNAYGHGLWQAAEIFASNGADFLGVDTLPEALSLRKAGLKKPILVLGYILNSRVSEAFINNISITVGSLEALKKVIVSLKENSAQKAKIHLKIETGLYRQGLFFKELPKALKLIKGNANIEIEGVYTHFASSDKADFFDFTLKQLAEFSKAVSFIKSHGYNPLVHCANTAAAIILPQSHFDMVRLGAGLYGISPLKIPGKKFIPALSWKTVIAQIKKVRKDTALGYDLIEKVYRNSLIAILPVGYWHGYHISLSRVGEVLVGGVRCKILGRVAMDMMIVDVTDVKKPKIEQEAVLIGRQGEETLTAQEIAAKLQYGNPREILTTINPLVPRLLTD